MAICPSCGKELPDGTEICDNCGAKLSAPAAETGASEAPAKSESKKPLLTPQLIKLLIVAGIALVVIIILIIVLVNAFKTVEPESVFLYTKDGDYYYSDIDGKGVKINVKGKPNSFYVTDDMDYVFYYANGGVYRSSTKNDKNDPIKVASTSGKMHISKNGNLVTFIDNNKLYQYNCKKEEKGDAIATDVTEFKAREDGGAILFQKNDGSWYYKKGSSDPVKVGQNLSLQAWNEDLSRVVFTQAADGKVDLYFKKTSSEDKEKIASEVGTVRFAMDDDDLDIVYYTKSEEGKTTLYKWKSGDTTTVTKDFAGFVSPVYEDYDFYYKKYTGETFDTEIWYFDGKNSKKITSEATANTLATATKRPLIVYTVTDGTQRVLHVAIEDDDYKVKTADNFYNPELSTDGKVAYFIDDVSNGSGALMKVKLGSKPGDPDKIDSDVQSIIDINDDNEVVYKKDSSSGKYSLYIDGNKADDDVVSYIGSADGYFYYLTDDNTLKYSSGKKGEKIISDCGSAGLTDDGKLVFVDTDKNVYYSRKAKLIDKDITSPVGVSYTSGGKNENRYYRF